MLGVDRPLTERPYATRMVVTEQTGQAEALTEDELERIDRWWRAANYLAVGQIYLLDNPLLREPLKPEHIKPRLLGHWGTTPGLNFMYAHAQPRHQGARPRRDLCHWPRPRRPGGGGQRLPRGHLERGLPAASAQDEEGMRKLFRSSRSRAASAATSRPRCPARSTRAASWATRSRTPLALPSTTPDLHRFLRRWRRRGGDRTAGGELAFQQVPQPGARWRGRCRSCT